MDWRKQGMGGTEASATKTKYVLLRPKGHLPQGRTEAQVAKHFHPTV